jgi:6-phosphofructokinase 1
VRLGSAGIAHLARGEHGVMVGMVGGRVAVIPLPEVVDGQKTPDLELMELARVLAR